MKILIDGRLLARKPTGISRYTLELIESYKRKYGPDSVYVLCFHDTPFEGNKIFTRRKPFNLWDFLGLHRELRAHSFDIYHAAFYSGLAFKPKGVFVIVTFHDLMFYRVSDFFSVNTLVNRAARFYYYVLVGLSIRTADMLVSVSKATADDLLEIYGRESIVIPEGVSDELTSEGAIVDEAVLREYLSANGVEFKAYFLYVGNNRRHKNIEFLKEAFRKSSVGKKLLLVGFADSQGDEGGDILNFPTVDDRLLKMLYAGCIAFVFPSLYEGFGLPVLEAIGNRAFVFLSNGGALKEFDFDSIKYFDPRKQGDLINLFRDWERYSFKDGDIERLKEGYNWKDNFDRFQDHLEAE